jgi:hypothetical protein
MADYLRRLISNGYLNNVYFHKGMRIKLSDLDLFSGLKRLYNQLHYSYIPCKGPVSTGFEEEQVIPNPLSSLSVEAINELRRSGSNKS